MTTKQTLTMTLSSRGNPDHGQDPDAPLWGCPGDAVVAVESMAQASELARAYIQENELGGGSWNGGAVFDASGAKIARVAYNGRVFAPNDRDVLHEPGSSANRERDRG